jgi:hypothetical protein
MLPCRSSRCTAASLNSLVNILLDNPMTQFSFGWILSLNWLSQKWGQVQSALRPICHSATVAFGLIQAGSDLRRPIRRSVE